MGRNKSSVKYDESYRLLQKIACKQPPSKKIIFGFITDEALMCEQCSPAGAASS